MHSSILAWKSLGQRSLVGYSSWDCKKVGHNLATKQQQILMYIQLQYFRKTIYSLLVNTFKNLLDLGYQVEPYEITDIRLFFN